MPRLISTKLIIFSHDLASEDYDRDCNAIIERQNHDDHNLTPLPTAYLELTPACNNRCLGCSNVFLTDKPTRQMKIVQAPLGISEWRTILNKSAPYIDRVSISGGEPTLYKYFAEFTDLLNKYNLSFTLFTNARWPQPEAVVQALSQTQHLRGLLVSLHGSDAATHEAFTILPGSFDETIANTRLATQAGIPVTLSTIITQHSYTQSEAVYQLGQELGVRQVVFNRYVGQTNDDCAPTPAQLKQALIDIEALRIGGAKVKLSVTVPQCFHPTSATGCGAGDAFITVDPWGNVKPCNHTPMILGNLRYDSVEKIMASQQLNYWRNLPMENCQDCSALAICGGGCRAEAMLNRTNYDTLATKPFLPEDKTNFLVLPDYLHPIITQELDRNDFSNEITPEMKDVLLTSLNGANTLNELGIQHGQHLLDLIGTMHQEGVVEFM